MKMRGTVMLLCLGWLAPSARANVKPHALCTEGMILQQKEPAQIWGTADNGEAVVVTFRGATARAEADANGKWHVTLPAGAAGGPFEMTIKGNNTINFKNVLVGEVWICSGQSNMEWRLGGSNKTDKAYASSAPHNPMLRYFDVRRNPRATPQSETGGKWVDADPKTVNGFTAVGYFFGRNLQDDLKVPVGLIHTSWGGTRIEAWMNPAVLDAVGVKEKAPDKVNPNTASALYNGMIHPLLNYRVKGAIWYQGESNTGQAYKYRTLFPAMIESWRADWKNPNLAFYFVQLAPFSPIAKTPGESNWAVLREGQGMALRLKNTGQAVITDFGNEYNIHPTPKRPVGDRLALAARARTYGEKIVASGPTIQSVDFLGNKAVVTFANVGSGLESKELVLASKQKIRVKGKNGEKAQEKELPGGEWRVKEGSTGAPLIGFTVCGADKVFHPATAQIAGDTVIVTSPQVSAPIAVRFGWADHPLCNLFNREGLPASPFRTDTFPVRTQPK